MLAAEEPAAPAPVEADRGGAFRWTLLARIAPIVPALVAIVGVAMLYIGDAHVRDARAAATAQAELRDARSAAGANPLSITPLYLEAGAEESLGRYAAARGRLLAALRREPDNFATLGLLGDFELRRGNRAAAHRWYARALAKNPRDIGLRELVRRTGP